MKYMTSMVGAILLSAASASAALETQFMQGLGDTRYSKVDSKIVGRPYHIYVMLPEGYDESGKEKYPTIYLLDGGALFPLFSAYSRSLNFGEELPSVIIVGISYGSDNFEGGNYRSTDFTAKSSERSHWGGAGAFQSFLSDELMPLIENTYRSRADRRVIFGQSIGGQFVLYTALTKPSLFWGHIASNPALHRNLPFFLRAHAKSVDVGEQTKLFVGSGSLDDPTFRAPVLRWMRHWSSQTNLPWRLKTATLDGHTHMSAPPATFRQGAIWLFSQE